MSSVHVVAKPIPNHQNVADAFDEFFYIQH